MPVTLVWRTDVHLADKGPSSRRDDWVETVFDKLSQVRDIATEVMADAILDGGDFFHVKSPTRNSHHLVQRTVSHHSTYPCPVYCTPGNHDSVYGDYQFLPQQPLGVLFASGVFHRLYDEHEAVFTKCDKYGKTIKVRVVGVPYHGTSYDMSRFTSIKKGDEDILICVAHVLASHKGGTMYEGEDIIRYSDLLDTAPDVFLFGHWHKNQGVETIGGKQFVNVGSLTRGSLSQDDAERVPSAVILNCDLFNGVPGVHIEVKELKVQPFSEVFDLEARARQVKRQVDMDSFVESIRNTLVTGDSGETLSETVGKMQEVPGEIRERALHYLEMV